MRSHAPRASRRRTCGGRRCSPATCARPRSRRSATASAGLERFGLTVLRPLQPMLAQTADDVEAALERIGAGVVEWKLDGARLQVHRLGDEVRAFTRNLADVTDRVPEVVEAVARSLHRSIVLDGEVIALQDPGGRGPFQVTMSRFGTRAAPTVGRRSAVAVLLRLPPPRRRRPARPAADGAPRGARLRLPEALRVPRLIDRRPGRGRAFLADVLARGHEGVMVKALDAPLRGRAARQRLAEGEARAHARSRRARGRVGSRPPDRPSQQPAPRCPRRASAASSCSARRSRG